MQKHGRYKRIIELRSKIKKFLRQVSEEEQPLGRIRDLAQDARRHRGVITDLKSHVDILQVRNRLLTTVLLIRCDYTILLAFLGDWKSTVVAGSPVVQVDFSTVRKDCDDLIAESHSRKQPGNAVEGHLYWARFLNLEQSFTGSGQENAQLLEKVKEHLQIAQELCDEYPGQTAGMRAEIQGVQKMMRGSTFYMSVSNEEKAAVYAAMANDFRGTGHWYYCENGHPFTIGECGMAMETSQCPQCGSPIGGQNHRTIDDVRPATDMEHEFGGLRL